MDKITALLLSAVLMLSAASNSGADVSVPAESAAVSVSVSADESASAWIRSNTTIYTNPTTKGASLGTVSSGAAVTIRDRRSFTDTAWAQIDTGTVVGWVPMEMLEYRTVNHDVTLPAVARLLTSPDSNSDMLVLLKKGDVLTVIRMQYVSGIPWIYVHSDARDMNGWVYAKNLDLDAFTPLEPTPTPTESAPVTTTPEPVVYARMGVVIHNYLNIRSAPGVNNPIVGTYNYGDRVGIIQIDTGWGRTTQGWICLDYVYLDGNVGANPSSGTVTASQLHIRSGPGTGYSVLGNYHLGDRVAIMEQIQLGYTWWGYTSLGWICMDYVTPGSVTPPTTAPFAATGYVNTTKLNIRSGPGTQYPIVRYYGLGDPVSFLEIATVNGVSWGRTPAGWVCMIYVSLTEIYDKPATTDPEETKPEDTKPTETDPEETVPKESHPIKVELDIDGKPIEKIT